MELPASEAISKDFDEGRNVFVEVFQNMIEAAQQEIKLLCEDHNGKLGTSRTPGPRSRTWKT